MEKIREAGENFVKMSLAISTFHQQNKKWVHAGCTENVRIE
jgi:hypothetical protein